MMTGRPPFLDQNHFRLGQLIKSGPIVFPDPEKHKISMSSDVKDLILKLLERDPAKRLGSKGDSAEILEHPFFKGIDLDKLLQKKVISITLFYSLYLHISQERKMILKSLMKTSKV
jgi:serine/threonine protein kinase